MKASALLLVVLFAAVLTVVAWRVGAHPRGDPAHRGARPVGTLESESVDIVGLGAEHGKEVTSSIEEREEVLASSRMEPSTALALRRNYVLGSDQATILVHVEDQETGEPFPMLRVSVQRADSASTSVRFEGGPLGGINSAPLTDSEGNALFVVPALTDLVVRTNGTPGVAGPARVLQKGLLPGTESDLTLSLETLSEQRFVGIVSRATTGSTVSHASVLVMNCAGVVQEVTTSADGVFAVDVPAWERTHARIESPGLVTTLVDLGQGHDALAGAMHIRMAEASSIRVQVVDATGQGVPGLPVSVSGPARALLFPQVVEDSWPGATYASEPCGVDAEWSGVTDGDGNCIIDGLPPFVGVRVEEPQRGDVLVLQHGERRGIQVRLGAGAQVHGQLLDPVGRPLRQCEVQLSPFVDDSAPPELQVNSERTLLAYTGQEGQFVFSDVPVGTWLVATRETFMGSHRDRTKVVQIGPDTKRVDVLLRQEAKLFVEGIVVGEGGEPLDEANVTAVSTVFAGVLGATTDVRGRFSIGPMVSSDVVLHVRSDTHVHNKPVHAFAGQTGVVVSCLLGGRVTGRVSDGEGGHVQAKISAGREGQTSLLAHGFQEGDSGFHLDGLRPGTYFIVATTRDGKIGIVRDVPIGAGEDVSEVVIEVQPASSLCLEYAGDDVLLGFTVSMAGIIVADGHVENGVRSTVVVPAGSMEVKFYSGPTVVACRSVQLTLGERGRVELVRQAAD